MKNHNHGFVNLKVFANLIINFIHYMQFIYHLSIIFLTLDLLEIKLHFDSFNFLQDKIFMILLSSSLVESNLDGMPPM